MKRTADVDVIFDAVNGIVMAVFISENSCDVFEELLSVGLRKRADSVSRCEDDLVGDLSVG